jgi:methylmalonyl-CoA/ethylmalonyl-CoA epimerase
MIERIAHIGIAVRDWEAQLALYRDLLKLPLLHIEEVADQGVRTAMFKVGESTLELLSPLSDDSPVAKFLAQRGEGFHHIAYAVSDLSETLRSLQAEGIDLIDETPRRGADGCLVAFIHPRSTRGVLTELCERSTTA